MTSRQSRARLQSEVGLSIIELLVATVLMVTVTGAVFQLMNPSQGSFQAQPEVSDMQQRMRVGTENLYRDVVMAGAGSYLGPGAGALSYFFAPIMPYNGLGAAADQTKGIYYRSDAITLIYVPPTPSQTTISDPMPPQSSEMKVNPQANCPPGKQDQLCGFEEGMRLIVFDQSGNWDPFTITKVQDAAAHLQHQGQDFSVAYAQGAFVTQVKTFSYYLHTDIPKNEFQLMQYDGYNPPVPVVDHVVKLEFEYFGEPAPPELLPNKPLSDPKGPWTTYGPKPPVLSDDNKNDTWGAGENCAFTLAGAAPNQTQVPRLATLAVGVGQVKLDPAILKDGPWCPDATRTSRFDADLFRIRRVRVKLRVQAAVDSLRGPASALFTRGGTSTTSERWVPDQEIQFDITPRNLNLGR
jgi:hypothetical protein